MTATADFAPREPTQREDVRAVDGGRMILRFLLRLVGAALVIACLGLWLAPGASWETDLMLFKLILSVVIGVTGLGLMQASAKPVHPEIEIDPNAQELRLIRHDFDGVNVVLQRCRFEELHRAELRGTHLRLWDQSNNLIAEIAVSNRRAVASMLDVLRDTGKLAQV